MSVDDNSPALAFRIVPPEKEEWDTVGRLYRRPGFLLPENYREPQVYEALLASGDFVPSITNVVDVRNSPHLIPWASKKVAQLAVDTARDWPGLIQNKPTQALKYLKNAANRDRDAAARQGTRIHRACELLSMGESIENRPELRNLTEYELAAIDKWKKFLDEFQPVFKGLEFTVFGKTEKEMGFAGTGDLRAVINGVDMGGDIKCVTDDTPVLLANGAYVRAADVEVGQEVVSWSKDRGLIVSNVSAVGDNGAQDTLTISTASGQSVEATLNHPFLASRNNRNLGFVEASDLKVGDSVYIALGWNHSPLRHSVEWPYPKYLSPYMFAVLWALINYNDVSTLSIDSLLTIPNFSRHELRDELKESGFTFNRKGELNLGVGLRKIAKKLKQDPEDVFEIIARDTLPAFVYSAPLMAQEALVAGIQEVFSNKQMSAVEFYAVLGSDYALRDLQQLYTNYGQPSRRGEHPVSKKHFLRIPYSDNNTIFIHGQGETKVTGITQSEFPQPTVAIEVEGAHNHVTGGLITHNTSRSGLHSGVALQLSAVNEAQEIAVDNKVLEPNTKWDMAVGLHVTDKSVIMKEVEAGRDTFEVFESLRHAWDFHSFDGKLQRPKGVFKRTIKSPKDI